LSASEWLESPSLVEIKAVTVNGIKQNAFTLKVNNQVPKVEALDGATIGAKSKLKGRS